MGSASRDDSTDWSRRLICALVGLLAANVAAFGCLLLWHELQPPAAHFGDRGLPLIAFPIAAYFASTGLLIVGTPVVFGVPPRLLNLISWWWVVPMGGLLGMMAMIADVMVMLPQHFDPANYAFSLQRNPLVMAGFPAISGSVGFSTYCWLLRRGAAVRSG